jgi:hypothetical protein
MPDNLGTMNDEVSIDRLRKQISRRGGFAFLLTVGDDGRSHSVSVDVDWDGDQLAMGTGSRSLANAKARPLVSLLWPARSARNYSLMVDGTVTSATGTGTGDNRIVISPTRAVLHRSVAPSDTPGRDRSCAPVYAQPEAASARS